MAHTYTKVELNKKAKADLIEIAEDLKLDTNGTKAELVTRILDAPADPDEELDLEEEDDEELEDESCDAIHFAGTIDVASLVEDEILLELPVFARHEVCEPPGPWEAGEKPSPFAVLAQLKRS